MTKHQRRRSLLLCVQVCCACVALQLAAEPAPDDGLAARRARMQEKSLGDHLLDLPGHLIYLPIEVLSVASKQGILIAESPLATRVQYYLSGALAPVIGFGSRPGFESGLALSLKRFPAESTRLSALGTYSTTTSITRRSSRPGTFQGRSVWSFVVDTTSTRTRTSTESARTQ